MENVVVKLAQTVELIVTKDALDIYDLDAGGVKVYRCSLTVNKEEASALIAALELVHKSFINSFGESSMNLLITGSRDYQRLPLVEAVLYAFVTTAELPHRKGKPVDKLFVGDARGVDRAAAKVWRKERNSEPEIFRAQWLKHGNAAGPIRNSEMLKAFIDAGGGLCFAFWDGKSRGTLDMMRKVIAAGMSVMLPEGFHKIDEQTGTGDLRMRYVPNQEELDKLLKEANAQGK